MSYDMYEDCAVSIFPSITKITQSQLKEYFSKSECETLANIIIKKCVNDAKIEFVKGIIPKRMPEIYLKDKALNYISKIREQFYKYMIDDPIKDRIDQNQVILITGAGFSVSAGIPLLNGIDSILKNCNVKDWEELRNTSRQMDFKKRFKDSVDSKIELFKDNKAHAIAAKSFTNKKIIEIISLNWDNLIEKNWKMHEIRKINRHNQEVLDDDGDKILHYLWKFQGDVEDLNYDWIFPDMDERIFPQFLKYMSDLKLNVRILLIIGYSEKGRNGNIGSTKLCQEVISPLENVFNTYRIGMDLYLLDRYSNYIVLPAEVFMLKYFNN